jgi:hypothetical protein
LGVAIDPWIWSFGHILIELSPLFVMPVALKFLNKPIDIPSLLGDGILYFFSLVLVVGLFSDVLKDQQRPEHLAPYQMASLLMGTFVVFGAAWLGYFLSLLQRVDGKPRADYLSVVLAAGLGVCLLEQRAFWVMVTNG